MDASFQLGTTLVALERGGLIVYPTDTVWGIGCDATNEAAVARVNAFKQRPPGKGLIVLVDSVAMLKHYVAYLHPRLQTLLDVHARPLSMVYPEVEGLAPGVLAADGSAAIRVTKDPYCRALIGSFGRPIVSTSANAAGQPFPSHYGAISSEVLRAADHVVRHRQCDRSPHEPSVVARWNENNELEPIRG